MRAGVVADVRVTSLQFSEVFDRLCSIIAARGLTLFDVIDHQAAAAESGLVLRPTRVLIFGSPAAGTPLMVRWPILALELPLRIVIWEADDHRTGLGFLTAEALVTLFELDPAGVAPLSATAAIVAEALGDDL